ncbi:MULTISPECIES: hypothetical protein [Crateriforma]|uniref:Uncharacterized protein n=1 Tax=Crateriforma conspicua TaxID=2527996 RepID=A0A5C6FPQ6_9PLAN|nr:MULTISPECIES: hypothetical protein [Crateriforma]TWU64919.1 hypothetical protein V7x_04630 [Crateriforma conspicua]
MAKCDEGYRCEVCGEDVTSIVDSDLYLRYVIGEIDPEVLHTTPERHLRCNPVLAQFIADDRFQVVEVAGPMDRRQLDPTFCDERTQRVTAGYRRLHEINTWAGDRDVTQYPLPDVLERWQRT